jgi:hypothetical protein
MSLPALYELTAQYREALAVLTDNDELPVEVIRDTLESLSGSIELKSTNVAKFVLGLEAEAAAIEAAAEAIHQRGVRRKKRAESIRAYLLLNLQTSGISRVECPEFTIAIRKNPPAVEMDDFAVVPERYMFTPEPPAPRPDKKLLAAALKAGEQIPGAWLKQGEHLSIKS